MSKHIFSKLVVNFQVFLRKSLVFFPLSPLATKFGKTEDMVIHTLDGKFLLMLIPYVMGCPLSVLNYSLSLQNEMEIEEGITQII